jgi:putative transposase
MARPLRIEIPGGRYHLTARGNERRNIFRDDRDRLHFLDLLSELPERFGTRLHAYVLIDNHYHLLIETPEANLSRTGQWLNVSYSVWFNRRHRRQGHLLQGRFGAVLVEDDAGWQEVGRYAHLNPVRVMKLGLGKEQQRAGRLGLSAAPTAAVVSQRLRVLRQWRWSSYPAYAGYVEAPLWLETQVLGSLCGGRSDRERRAALRAYTEEAVREGLPESPWERVVGGAVLGTREFAESLKKRAKANRREQPGIGQMSGAIPWPQIVRAIEVVKKDNWNDFRDRYGDWGRDAALWFGRRLGRLRLSELAELAGGIDYSAAGAAVSRFARRLRAEPALQREVSRIEKQLSNFEI